MATLALVWAAQRRAVALVAKVSHELAMDAAVAIHRVSTPADAARLVRSSVDPELADALARRLGPAYERYLDELFRRASGS